MRRKNRTYTYQTELMETAAATAVRLLVAAVLSAIILCLGAFVAMVYMFGLSDGDFAVWATYFAFSLPVSTIAVYSVLRQHVFDQLNTWTAPPTPPETRTYRVNSTSGKVTEIVDRHGEGRGNYGQVDTGD